MKKTYINSNNSNNNTNFSNMFSSINEKQALFDIVSERVHNLRFSAMILAAVVREKLRRGALNNEFIYDYIRKDPKLFEYLRSLIIANVVYGTDTIINQIEVIENKRCAEEYAREIDIVFNALGELFVAEYNK